MVEACNCNSSDRVVLVFPCSGSSDVGELADRSARKLDQAGTAQMYCLAGLGAHVTGIVRMTKAVGSHLAIDGCTVGCASKVLEQGRWARFAVSA